MAYKVGIIGTGFGVKVHLPAFRAHPDFEPVIIAGRNPDKTKELADANNVQGTTNWVELTQNPDLDLIAVSTPPYLHYKMAKKVLKSNKHLLLEKPTTSNAEQARELLIMARERNLIGLLCHEFRWLPYRMYLHNLIQEGKYIGELREIHGQENFGFAASPENPKFGWLWDSIYDGGLLGAAGSHNVDFLRFLTQKEFVDVSGRTFSRSKFRRTNGGELVPQTADDGFIIDYTLEGGITGVLDLSGTMSPTPSSRLVFGGTEGTIYVDGQSLYAAKVGEEFQELSIPEEFNLDNSLVEMDRRIPPFMKLLDQLSLSLKEGKSLTPSLYDGWKNQQVLDAVRLSQKTNSRIDIVDYL